MLSHFPSFQSVTPRSSRSSSQSVSPVCPSPAPSEVTSDIRCVTIMMTAHVFQDKFIGLDLPCTAAEMKQRITSK